MTVKVVDKQLYKWYQEELNRMNSNEVVDMVRFVDHVFRFLMDDEIKDNADIGYLAHALFTGEDVELVEPKYCVPMPGMGMDGEPQYLCRFSKDYLGTATYIPDGKNLEFTLDEIPEEYRKWAEEVDK